MYPMTKAQYDVESLNGEPITEEGRELGQYVRDLYASGAKLWTKEMFQDVESQLAQVPLPETIMIRSSTYIS